MKMSFAKKFIDGLIESGMQPKQAEFFFKLYQQDTIGFPNITEDERKWCLRRGFLPGRCQLFKLDDKNYQMYLPDYAYYMMHPFNNHFKFWVNDKLTLKYILNNLKLKYCMPEYYLYIENNGNYTYLMDAPAEINKNSDYIYNLLKLKGVLALKPNNGSEGIGFIKLEYKDENVICNNKIISMKEFKKIVDGLFNYTITEYCEQNRILKNIYSFTECTLRITMGKIQPTSVSESKWININCFARFGTNLSNGASNLDKGGLGVGIDFLTGEMKENGIRYQHYIKKEENYPYKRHPDTNISWINTKIPNWKLVQETVFGVCDYLNTLDYLAFDIIVTDDSLKLLEINTLPAMCYGQIISEPALADNDRRFFFESKGLNNIDVSRLYDIVENAKG